MSATYTAATRIMMERLDEAWDSLTPYAQTAEAGELAEPDAEALRAICDETGDDYDTAEQEVIDLCRSQVAISGR